MAIPMDRFKKWAGGGGYFLGVHPGEPGGFFHGDIKGNEQVVWVRGREFGGRCLWPLPQSRRRFKDGPDGRNGMVADYMKGQWMVKFLESKRVHVKAQSYGTFPT
eukprot:scaffold14968_cov70-Cyclotella_meneghiniana.AAC.2